MSFILAQAIPDPTKVIDTATGVSWEAGMLALIMVSCLILIGYMFKRQSDSSDRMATRLSEVENELRKIEKDHRDSLVAVSKEMANAITESTAARQSVHTALIELTRASNVLNGDLKELCQLLKLSPCIAIGSLRGDYKLIDRATGKEVELVRQKQDEQGEA